MAKKRRNLSSAPSLENIDRIEGGAGGRGSEDEHQRAGLQIGKRAHKNFAVRTQSLFCWERRRKEGEKRVVRNKKRKSLTNREENNSGK